MPYIDCKICGKTIRVKQSRMHERKYCSIKCHSIDQKNEKGENNNNYRDGGLKTCKHCGEKYKSYKTKRVCCSVNCANELKKGKKLNITPERREFLINHINRVRKQKTKKIYTCVCGKVIGTKRRKYCDECLEKNRFYIIKKCVYCNKEYKGTRNSHYCSKACLKEHRKIIMVGENNPNWKGGVKTPNQVGRNNIEHNEWIKAVFKRDNYTCQKCNQVGWELNAHHIKPWAKYKNLRYVLSNGLTLCKKCHKEVHRKKTA
jgi:hypothetical protein